MQLASLAPLAAEPGRAWLALAAIDEAALPTPVRALLRDVRDGTPALHTSPRVAEGRSGARAKALPSRQRSGRKRQHNRQGDPR
jgi:hypothetical protein